MIRMPWTNATAPNVMIEVVGNCNLACRTCYKKPQDQIKSLSAVKADLDSARQQRRLHTVALSGGEPTLHPDLCAIVAMLKRERLHVFLLTNGVLIDDEYLRRLKVAGLDSILFHVDLGQQRPDLPDEPTFSDVRQRLDELTGLAYGYGMDVSLSFTLYNEAEVDLICPYFMASSQTSFLFLSNATDLPSFYQGVATGQPTSSSPADKQVAEMQRFFQERYQWEPFAYIPTKSGQSMVWISYFIPLIYIGKDAQAYAYRSNGMDVFLMRMVKFLTGRYIHKTTHNVWITALRVALNGLAGWQLGSALRFLLSALRPGARLRHKMIVYDGGPFSTNGNTVDYCEYCPTAIIRDGELLSCCTADYGYKAVGS
jgi:hypothetical protein